jgi:serine/threonine-protein kinase
MTAAGVFLGTAAYMSPEQAKGQPADRRSDIWAFGCVLYEMLTAHRAFVGEHVADVLANVLKSDPNWALLPRNTPEPLRRLLQRSLVKETRLRLPHIGIARLELVDSDSKKPTVNGRPSYIAMMVAAAVAVVVGMGIGALSPRRAAVPAREPFALTISAPEGQQFGTTSPASDVAISSDARRVAFVTGTQTSGSLFVRELSDLTSRHLDGVAVPFGPFFSPDGMWVGVLDLDGGLKKVPVRGGDPILIAKIPTDGVRGLTWSQDGSIIFGSSASRALWRVRESGGEAEILLEPSDVHESYEYPFALPGGNVILFTIRPTASNDPSDTRIAAFDVRSREVRTLLKGGGQPQYAAGRLVVSVRTTLQSVPFDLDSLQLKGDLTPLAGGLMLKYFGAASYGVAENGVLAYLTGEQQNGADRTLVWVNRDGVEEAVGAPPRAYTYARVSPDGSKIAVDIRDQANDTWVWDTARRTLTRLTFDSEPNRGVAWTADGRRLAFGAVRSGIEGVDWTAVDGGGTPELLTAGVRPRFPNSFSPDGTKLLFSEPSGPPYDIGMVDLKSGVAEMLIATRYSEREPSISSNGRWIVYQSTESGRDEIYVRPFPNVQGGRWQVSSDGGTRPVWSRDGKSILYYQPPGRVFEVAVDTTNGFHAAVPKQLFAGNYVAPNDGRPFDVAPDGRLLMIRDDPRAARRQLVVSLR